MASFEDCVKVAFGKMKMPTNATLKNEQLQVLQCAFDGRDTIAVLPTGFGKSLIFQMLPYMMAAKFGRQEPMIVVVVAPINAIMEDQVRSLHSIGIMACYISYGGSGGMAYEDATEEESAIESENSEEKLILPKEVKLKEIMDGKFHIIYAHPECLINSKSMTKMLRSQTFHDRLCGIVIDEVHMIAEWGHEFRPHFKRLGELTCIHPKISHIALTATAKPGIVDSLAKTLMYENHKVIKVNPDRPNIFLGKQTRPPNIRKMEKYNSFITPIEEELAISLDKFPVTIAYMESLEAIGYCYKFLESKLKDKQFNNKERVPENRIFAQYHTDYTKDMKRFLCMDLTKKVPTVRLVLATVALGMGLNAPSVERVLHMRPPVTLENYMQEIGRAGRSGQPASATLYFNNSDIAKNRKGMTEDMVKYCNNSETCLRLMLVNYFGFSKVLYSGPKKDCCANCRQYANN